MFSTSNRLVKAFLVLGILIGINPRGLLAQTQWPQGNAINKPWFRWWWMGSAVDEANLDRELTLFSEAGVGGVEITPIYGAKGYEKRYLSFLSPEWVNKVSYTVKAAKQHGMRVDLNVGTGWPFGGPQIGAEEAAGKLVIRSYPVNAGQTFQTSLALPDSALQTIAQASKSLDRSGHTDGKPLPAAIKGVLAVGPKGERQVLTDLLSSDDLLEWKAPAGTGTWTLYVAYGGHTSQMVKRAALGGEGYVMDHFSKKAFQTYLARFDQAFEKEKLDFRSFFNDSYEVYGADFTPDFFDEFKKRRGYDVIQYLPELEIPTTSDSINRIRADYRQTLAELVYERFSGTWYDWVKQNGALSRNQAHGFPGNIIDIYAHVDIPEPEMFGVVETPIKGIHYYTSEKRNADPDPVMMKMASSAAHLLGKPLVSCEIFTWMGEHFKIPLAHAKPEAQQAFLTGVNHTIYHGATYSPQDAPWPGWLFYASTNFAPSNTWWPHVKALNTYIERCQTLLQQGKADHELLIYWPYMDAQYHAGESLAFQVEISSVEKWLFPTPFYRTSRELMKQGYGVDFISDHLLSQSHMQQSGIQVAPEGTAYKTLLVPEVEFMPPSTLEQLLRVASEGATVIFSNLPQKAPGLNGLKEAQQLSALISKIQFGPEQGGIRTATYGKGKIWVGSSISEILKKNQVFPEEFVQEGIQFVRKKVNGDTYYYLVNHTDRDIDQEITLKTKAKEVIIMDPEAGNIGLAQSHASDAGSVVYVQLKSGEALFLRCTDTATGIPAWHYTEKMLPGTSPQAMWKLTLNNEQYQKTYSLPQLKAWTDLQDKAADTYSGIGTYEAEFDFQPTPSANNYLLDLGDVRESAEVWINNQHVGIAWHPPYELAIGSYLKPGKNHIRIAVANLMANRIAEMDRKGVPWKIFHEINFVDVLYNPFNAANWPVMTAGLPGAIQIRPVVYKH